MEHATETGSTLVALSAALPARPGRLTLPVRRRSAPVAFGSGGQPRRSDRHARPAVFRWNQVCPAAVCTLDRGGATRAEGDRSRGPAFRRRAPARVTAVPAVADDRVGRLWLDALEEIAARGAHELRGSLNGVAVNVEVVRSRTLRGGTDVAATAPFAAAAATELAELTRRLEALVSLTQRPREPVDVLVTLDHLVSLLAPSARADGGSLVLEAACASATTTAAPAEPARLVLATACLAASSGGTDVTCRVTCERAIIVKLWCDAPLGIAGDVATVAAAAGIELDHTSTGITMAFPALEGRAPYAQAEDEASQDSHR